MTQQRYHGNLGSFSRDELAEIAKKSVCVVGCGGLGGYVCNALARFGVGSVTVVDGDDFSESNLNRQFFARADTLGKNKAAVCAQELLKINVAVPVVPVPEFLSQQNAAQILKGHDLVIECLDSAEVKIMLEDKCEELGLSFVHGAINGFFGHVAVVLPGDRLMKKLYAAPEAQESPDGGSPVFTAQAVSAIQCSEAFKLLAGRPSCMRSKLLHINLEDNEFSLLDV